MSPMVYRSTRDGTHEAGFEDALLTGLAPGGGLYMPSYFPVFDRTALSDFATLPYWELSRNVMWPFVSGALPFSDFSDLVYASYIDFPPDCAVPLREIGENLWLLELFHGPTLAFKDIAMQFLSRMMDYFLSRRDRRATIIVATSGDTGAAAASAFADRDRIDLFILYPSGGVSDVQRRQMTSTGASNIYAIAVDGMFDDCQFLVKSLFGDKDFCDRYHLCGVNSINWARIQAQTVYYFSAFCSLGDHFKDSEVIFSVPTGNFGDIYAGHIARHMGLPIAHMIGGVNENDSLYRLFSSGIYDYIASVPTTSPAMDISRPSNLERLLFEYSGNDVCYTNKIFGRSLNHFTLGEDILSSFRSDFNFFRVDTASVASIMYDYYKDLGLFLDPHTCVGLNAGLHYRAQIDSHRADKASSLLPLIVLSTASAAKFPETVSSVCGVSPPVPDSLSLFFSRHERVWDLSVDIDALKSFIALHSVM